MPRQLWHERFLHICSDLHGISSSCGAQSLNTSKTRHNTEKCVFSDAPSSFHKVEDKIEIALSCSRQTHQVLGYSASLWFRWVDCCICPALFDCETTQIAAKHHRDSKMSLVGGRWNVRNVFSQRHKCLCCAGENIQVVFILHASFYNISVETPRAGCKTKYKTNSFLVLITL